MKSAGTSIDPDIMMKHYTIAVGLTLLPLLMFGQSEGKKIWLTYTDILNAQKLHNLIPTEFGIYTHIGAYDLMTIDKDGRKLQIHCTGDKVPPYLLKLAAEYKEEHKHRLNFVLKNISTTYGTQYPDVTFIATRSFEEDSVQYIPCERFQSSTTLQELSPTLFGHMTDLVSYEITFAFWRCDIITVQGTGSTLPPKVAGIVNGVDATDHRFTVYVDALKRSNGEEYEAEVLYGIGKCPKK